MPRLGRLNVAVPHCLHRRSRGGLVRDHVGDDQGRGEEDQAKEEVAEKAVAFSSRNTRRPECDRDPDRDDENRPEPPSVCSEKHWITSSRSTTIVVSTGSPYKTETSESSG